MTPALTFSAVLVLGFAASSLGQEATSTNAVVHVQSAQFSPDGQRMATTSADGTQRIWDAQTGRPQNALAPHLGAWRLVSVKYGEADKWSEAPQDQKRIKLITGTHFTWVAYEAASGKVLTTAGGPYTLTGGAYTETIEFAGEGMTDYLGKKQTFTIRIEGDKLHQSGQLSDGMKIEEVWQRMK